MKKFKITSTITLIGAIVLFAIGLIISAISDEALELTFLAMVEANALILSLVGVGTFLMFSKNETARKVGHGLATTAFTVGFICAIFILAHADSSSVATIASGTTNTTSKSKSTSIGALIVIISAVVFVVHYAFRLVAFMLDKSNGSYDDPEKDLRVVHIKQWKQLLDDGIITENEYNEKRMRILGIKAKDEKTAEPDKK